MKILLTKFCFVSNQYYFIWIIYVQSPIYSNICICITDYTIEHRSNVGVVRMVELSEFNLILFPTTNIDIFIQYHRLILFSRNRKMNMRESVPTTIYLVRNIKKSNCIIFMCYALTY